MSLCLWHDLKQNLISLPSSVISSGLAFNGLTAFGEGRSAAGKIAGSQLLLPLLAEY